MPYFPKSPKYYIPKIYNTFAYFVFCVILSITLFREVAFAAPDIKINKYYFQPEAVQYQNRRLYVIFENASSTKDFYGSASIVCKTIDGKSNFYGVSQILSIFKSSTDGVFFDDEVFFAGDFDCDFEVKDIKGNVLIDEVKKLVSDIDTDRDGLGNKEDEDDDSDGLTDVEEARLGTNSLMMDTDGDGINDKVEVSKGLNPLKGDTDGDGVLDKSDEFPLDKNDDGRDSDGDGLSDKLETILKTDSNNKDTDGDGVPDGLDSFPLNKLYSKDVNKDGIPDDIQNLNLTSQVYKNNEKPIIWVEAGAEKIHDLRTGVRPESLNKDADKDGLSDYDEYVIYKSNSKSKDTDGDGLNDDKELKFKTNLNNKDTDGDGVSDSRDIFKLDSTNGAGDDDRDGLASSLEKRCFLNPNNPRTFIIKDYYSYLIIRYAWILILFYLIFRIYRGYKLRQIERRERIRYEKVISKNKLDSK